MMSETRLVIRSVSPQPHPLAPRMKAKNLALEDAPLPGTVKFNDVQTAHWTAQSPPRLSLQIKKLGMLNRIAHDQEKAGLHFEGRRSAAEAEIDLMNEHLAQTSQAAQAHNPFSFIIHSAKALARDFYFYLDGNPSVSDTFDKFSTPIDDSSFIVRKSNSLIKKEAAAEAISGFGVGLIDSSHTSVVVQNGIKAFLNAHFNAGRGDIFLAEAVLVADSQNGEERFIKPNLELHHSILCFGVPIQSCRILKEAEKEVDVLIAAVKERRDLVNRVFEFFMNAIPPSKAFEARQKLRKRNQEIRTVDTSFKLGLLAEYQDYCDPDKQTRLQRRVDSLKDAYKKQKEAEAATQNARDKAYFNQISHALQELKPGARLYYTLGGQHFEGLNNKLDEIDGFFIDIVNPKAKDEL